MSKNRKSIFFTSDQHFFHKNCIDFDNRPFKDVDHMHRVLINNYNHTVPEDGICYFVGDFSMGNSEQTKEILSKLNGTKILIIGNHDAGINSMYSKGFDVVLNTATICIAGEMVTISHCPLRGVFRENTEGMRGAKEGENWHGESRHQKFSLEDTGQFHLHGHLHSSKEDCKLGRQYDIGVVANNYYPVSLSQVESWIAEVKRNEA